ncbi:N-acetylglucosamine-6-phosphate deacetylase [Pedobacter duraquae]|uniref:N-acetylglucosamine-6-phosphate deacetylase n=1 Tax=Pedobacter duraquae TaxID=425511 RepID=A0A4R6IHJ8_9SPHI|nr:N-acetylglucosamine-6-phosphate deacetylase [Pedobacter duraquae]TDO21387.1 N-acetylglucosamine-6-phosphate deacetylase [Pedobacter duraquae]
MIAITNCSFYDDAVLKQQSILIDKGVITGLVADQDIPQGCQIIDAQQALVASACIELQIYGSGGKLFSAFPTVDTLRQMDQDLLDKGHAGFLACLATNAPEVFNQAIDAAKAYRAEAKTFLGLHLEGPYLNPRRLGAHIGAYVKKATLDEVKTLMERADGVVKMMTIAAELQDDAVIQYLLDQGVVLSLGHSDANFDEATAAYNNGITTTTHLFNAMPSIHHRAPNLPTAILNHQSAMASIIADGMHVDFEVLRFAKTLMGERLFLITDAVTPCDTGAYQHSLEDGKFVMPDGTLSGSAITMLQAIKNCVEYAGITLPEALRMASLYPSRVLGLDTTMGNIGVGKQANLMLLNADLKLQKIMFRGVEHLITNN